MHLHNVKRALLQLQVQLKKLGCAEIYLTNTIFGFSSKKDGISTISANL